MAVNDIDELVNKCWSRQNQSPNKTNRQVEMFRLQASDASRQQLLQQAELTVATDATLFIPCISQTVNQQHMGHDAWHLGEGAGALLDPWQGGNYHGSKGA